MFRFKNIRTIVKFILPILFFLCLLDMPDVYYEFLKLLGMFGLYYAYKAHLTGSKTAVIIYVGFATLLFQSFLINALGRELWNAVGVIVGIGLLASIFISSKKSKN